MVFKRPIYRILFFAAWILLLGGIATLVIAANGKSQVRLCKGVEVTFANEEASPAVNKNEVLQVMEKVGGPYVNKPQEAIELSVLERTLETNPWIEDAELYFNTKGVLNVSVKERMPVARVFTTIGNSFYMDSTGHRMPLLKSWSARLPVVTGFTPAIRLGRRDSLVLQGVKEVVRFISNDEFWNAQVGQIDITPEGKFELVPVISDAVIRLGYADDIEQKLANLMVFYKQVMPKAGFTKYAAVDVQFDGQVVAVKKGTTSVIDSIQLQKNIAELMKRKEAEQHADSIVAAAAPRVVLPVQPTVDSVNKPAASTTTTSVVPVKPQVKPAVATANRSSSASNPVKPRTTQPKPSTPKPKPAARTTPAKPRAVMPERNEY